MIRLSVLCAAAALVLSACAGGTADPYASTAGQGGMGGVTNAGMGAGMGAGQPGRGAAGSQEDLVQYAGDRIFFDTDQSIINDQARAVLERQAQWLQQNPRVSIWVAGNCDERGTEEYNLALGQRRASADRDYLASRGIDARRIETISYGKTRPIDPGSTPDSWTRNRNAITSVR